ncbi:MAG: phosphoglycerate mutase family protein [Arenimonas sp.]
MKVKFSKVKFSTACILFLSMLASPILMAADTMIIVVRHAEKATDDPKDPSLSEQGNARANALAEVLKDSDLKAVYSTQYKRTRLTGTPSATKSGLEVEALEVNKQNDKTYVTDLIKKIQKDHKGETVLIVGHSNTVPEIVKYTTGKDIAPIGEDEFSRIYIITLGKEPRLVSATYNP